MATFFGEILSSPSRAVDEDDDDDDEDREPVTQWQFDFSWEDDPEVKSLGEAPLPRDLLLIAVGPSATLFAQTHLLCESDSVIATLGKSSQACQLFRSRSSLVLLSPRPVPPEASFAWTQQLLARLSPAKIVVLTTSHVSDFKSDITADLVTPFLRSLAVGDCPVKVKSLEQPNTIAGLPAQILTFCHLRHIKAVLFVCYADTLRPDYWAARGFASLLKSVHLSSFQSIPDAERRLITLLDRPSAGGDLYI